MLGEYIRAKLRAFNKMEMRHKTNTKKIREHQGTVRMLSAGAYDSLYELEGCFCEMQAQPEEVTLQTCILLPLSVLHEGENSQTAGGTANIWKENLRQGKSVPHAREASYLGKRSSQEKKRNCT